VALGSGEVDLGGYFSKLASLSRSSSSSLDKFVTVVLVPGNFQVRIGLWQGFAALLVIKPGEAGPRRQARGSKLIRICRLLPKLASAKCRSS
jgi:hypothetical protein